MQNIIIKFDKEAHRLEFTEFPDIFRYDQLDVHSPTARIVSVIVPQQTPEECFLPGENTAVNYLNYNKRHIDTYVENVIFYSIVRDRKFRVEV